MEDGRDLGRSNVPLERTTIAGAEPGTHQLGVLSAYRSWLYYPGKGVNFEFRIFIFPLSIIFWVLETDHLIWNMKFHISYKWRHNLSFQFEVKPHGFFSFDLEVEIPVIIGNVAFDPNPFNKPPQAYLSGIHLNKDWWTFNRFNTLRVAHIWCHAILDNLWHPPKFVLLLVLRL